MKTPSVVLTAAAILALAAPALAAGKPSQARRAAVLQAIVDCRAMTDTNARLACYDAAAAKLDEAESSGQVVVVDREQATKVRKEVFGLQLPSLDIFGGKGAPEALKGEGVDQLTATIKQASQGVDGKWVIELDTGAVWRQIEGADVAVEAR